jgi:hypothetical protein
MGVEEFKVSNSKNIDPPTDENNLSPTAVLANTTGFIVYIRNYPASTLPWKIYRYAMIKQEIQA